MIDSLFRLLFGHRQVVFQQGEFRFVPTSGAYLSRGPRGRGRRSPRSSRIARRAAVTAPPGTSSSSRRFASPRWRCWSSACSGRCWSSRRRSRSRTSWPSSWTIRAACRSPTGTGSRAPISSARSSPTRRARSSRRCRSGSWSARFASRRWPPDRRPCRDLTFGGTQTRLGNAIESARQELAGLPLSGIVLVTDGADTTDASLSDALLTRRRRRCRCSPSASARNAVARHPGRPHHVRRARR